MVKIEKKKKTKLDGPAILQELYGVPVDTLVEFAAQAKQAGLDRWYEAFYFSEEDWGAFELYLKHEYRLKRLPEGTGMLLLDYSGAGTKDVVARAAAKVEKLPLFKEISLKRWQNLQVSLGRQEVYCEHGVGHGFHVHGCCGTGCCDNGTFVDKLLRKNFKAHKEENEELKTKG